MGIGVGTRARQHERLPRKRPGVGGREWGMVSEEARFFTDPDAPPPTEGGVGPPGPIVSGSEGNDKVGAGCCIGSSTFIH